MPDINGIKIEPKISLNIGNKGDDENGGDGGTVMIITEKLTGNGKISANGGDGKKGGKGGQVHIQAKQNSFTGEISANGGKSEK